MFPAIRSRDLGRPQDSTQAFQSKVLGSVSLIERLERVRVLEGHTGCVNTVGFSDCGTRLISGSDDKKIIIWDWQSGKSKSCFYSFCLPHHAFGMDWWGWQLWWYHLHVPCVSEGRQVLSYRSGHLNNIFQARFLPQTNNSTVVTCAADGQAYSPCLPSQIWLFSPVICLTPKRVKSYWLSRTCWWVDQDGSHPHVFLECTAPILYQMLHRWG